MLKGPSSHRSLGICVLLGLVACGGEQEAPQVGLPGLAPLKQALAANGFRAIVNLDLPVSLDSTGAGSSVDDIARRLSADYDLQVVRVFSLIPAFVATFDTAALVGLMQDDRVRSVEPDRQVSIPRE